jgi:hypothetical protein
MNQMIRLFVVGFFFALAADALAFEIQKTALYVFLREVKPIEEEAAKALEKEDYALALRKYREALKGYERIWKEYPDLADERPRGIDLMVDESIEKCKEVIDEIKDKGEAADELHQKLNEVITVDFSDEDIFKVAKALTFITDVNIIVDKAVFDKKNDALKSKVTFRTEKPWPLKAVIEHLCRQTGLDYSVEADHVFLSTRVKLDEAK